MHLKLISLFMVAALSSVAAPLLRPVVPAGPIQAGDEITIGVSIEDAIFINGYQFDIQFDPLTLEFLGASEGGFLLSPLFADPLFDSSDVSNGNVFAVSNYMADMGISGNGTLSNLQFRAIKSGEAFVTVIGGLYTSLDDWDNGIQVEITANTIESSRFTISTAQSTDAIPEPSTFGLVAIMSAAILGRHYTRNK